MGSKKQCDSCLFFEECKQQKKIKQKDTRCKKYKWIGLGANITSQPFRKLV